ncbi:MAG: histidine phosphatase family protein [Sphingobacteriales bacterium]|nr:histidine phosphatase family protein [Sphingobacteriales bacterium]
MRKELYIVRHAQTDFNLQGIVQGSGVDSDINDTGQQQAAEFYEKYKDEGFDAVATSSLKRTAQSVAGFLAAGIPHRQYAHLNEICWGIYEGKAPTADWQAAYESMSVAWRAGNTHIAPPQGESPDSVYQRLATWLLDELPHIEGDKILVCTHGRTLRIFMTLLTNAPLAHMERFGHANLGLYKVIYTPQNCDIVVSNEVQHLKKIIPV